MIQKSLIKVMLLITIVFFFSGCGKKDAVTKGVIGEFALNKFSYNDKDLLYNLNLNIIIFFKNGKVELPKIVDRYKDGLIADDNEDGTWELIQVDKKFQIEIKTKNIYFNKKFDLSFSKTKKNNIVLSLKNSELNLMGEKSYFDYRNNKSFVDEIIKYTK